MVTYSDLIQIGILIVGIISLFIQANVTGDFLGGGVPMQN